MKNRIAIVCHSDMHAQTNRPPIVSHVGEKEVNVLMVTPLNFEQTAELLEIAHTHGIKVNLLSGEDAKHYPTEGASIARSIASMKLEAPKIYDIEPLAYAGSYFREDRQQMSKREQRNRSRRHNY